MLGNLLERKNVIGQQDGNARVFTEDFKLSKFKQGQIPPKSIYFIRIAGMPIVDEWFR